MRTEASLRSFSTLSVEMNWAIIVVGLTAIVGIFMVYAHQTPGPVRKDAVVTQYVYDDEEDWWGPLPWSVGWTGWYNGWWHGERTRPGPGPRPHHRGGHHGGPRPAGGPRPTGGARPTDGGRRH